MLFFIVIMGLVVYNTILAGIISKSKFGMLGAIRRACQSVSYEISLSFQLLSLAVLPSRFILGSQTRLRVSFLMAGLWWVRCVCECNRAPFDFAEGERELIRGFNVEYSAVGFVFIFLSEYGIILALSLVTSSLFLRRSLAGFCFFFFTFCIFRATFPRYRFDLLIKFCWLAVLPLSISIFIFILYLWAFGVVAH
jgi:NADH-ubiquinone oxidoreductase chain 1